MYEKTEHSKVRCFLHISRDAEIHTIPKTQNMGIVNLLSTGKLWENTNIPDVWVSYILCTPYFVCNRNPYNSENMGKLNFHSKGNVWENTNIPKLWVSYIFHVRH